MPIGAFVVGQNGIDRGVIEIEHLLAGIAIVVFGHPVGQSRADGRAIALRDETDALIGRLLRLDQAFLRIGLVVEGDDLDFLAVQAAGRVDLVGEIFEGLQADFADRGAAARQRIDISRFLSCLPRKPERQQDWPPAPGRLSLFSSLPPWTAVVFMHDRRRLTIWRRPRLSSDFQKSEYQLSTVFRLRRAARRDNRRARLCPHPPPRRRHSRRAAPAIFRPHRAAAARLSREDRENRAADARAASPGAA